MADSNRIEQLLLSLRDENEGLRNHAATGLGQVGESAIPKSTTADSPMELRADVAAV